MTYTNPFHKHLGAELRAEMARREISVNKLAEHLGLTRSSTSVKLSGISPFSLNQLLAIKNLFGDITAGEIILNAERAQLKAQKKTA